MCIDRSDRDHADERPPIASVIVPMRNAAEVVLEQVAALRKQSGATNFEVIWVDNGSHDGTEQLVANATASDPRMRVIAAPEIRSSYFARSQGVAVAQSDLLLFCDADDVVDEHWVRSMTSALAHLDVVGGALKLGINEVAAVPAEPRWGFLPSAPTANLGIRREVYTKLGGFNPRIPFGEDTALCWRAQLQRFRFGFAPDAEVFFRRRSTEWRRIMRIWTSGRWYRDWASPFVALGADAPTISASLRRTIQLVFIPAMKHPRRDHARVLVWNLAIISSRLWRPRRRSTRPEKG